jgi:Domain of unknown function (DUF5666)
MTGAAGNALRRWIALAGRGRTVLAAALLCCLVGTALAQTTTTGGTGGIGGTGHGPGEGNGIGGTGAPQTQATGIVGTITGFGSILVNGYEVDYTAGTPAKSDLEDKLAPNSLRVGQVVEIEAEGEGQHVRARRIAVRYEVAGPIESIDHTAGTIKVLGQTVAPASIENLSVGDTVTVSGLRRGDQVIAASRVDGIEPRAHAWLRGRVEKAEDGGFTVNGVRMAPSNFEPGSRPSAGEEVAISGAYSHGTFAAAKVSRLPQVPFGGRAEHLSIEGYVASRSGGGHSVGGLGLEAGAAGSYHPGDRVIAGGKLRNGRFVPAEVKPSQFHGMAPGKRSDAHPYGGMHWRNGHAPAGHPPSGVRDFRGFRHPEMRNGRNPPHRLQHPGNAGAHRSRPAGPPHHGNNAKRGRDRKW